MIGIPIHQQTISRKNPINQIISIDTIHNVIWSSNVVSRIAIFA